MLPTFFDFLAPLGILLGVHLRNLSTFHFWAFLKGLKMPKITNIMFFFTFLGRLIWLPIAMLPTFFDFQTQLGIFLGVYFRNWSNFHFWAFSLEKVEIFFQNGLNYA